MRLVATSGTPADIEHSPAGHVDEGEQVYRIAEVVTNGTTRCLQEKGATGQSPSWLMKAWNVHEKRYVKADSAGSRSPDVVGKWCAHCGNA